MGEPGGDMAWGDAPRRWRRAAIAISATALTVVACVVLLGDGGSRAALPEASLAEGDRGREDADMSAFQKWYPERELFIDNLLVRIHFIIVMIRWTGLAPWEFEFPFPGSLTSTFLVVSTPRNPQPPTLNPPPP